MRFIVPVAVFALVACNAMAAQNGRPAMSGKMIMSAPRYTASVNQLNTMSSASNNGAVSNDVTAAVSVKPNPEPQPKPVVDTREEERNACLNNNVGVGNTFVWASRYSDTSNYTSMTEDLKNPENNVCFVRVELKSDDPSRVSVSDVPARYFMWGQNVECGSWANAEEIEKRILDARKGARIGGVVASSIGGAGVGVGAMELFGNKLIGGKVQGQKSLQGVELYRSQLLVLKDNNPSEYRRIVDALSVLKQYGGDTLTSEEKDLISEFADK